MKSVYKKLVTFTDAVRLAKETLIPLKGTEKVPITQSGGRILSASIFATRNNPPFNRATMDGYAVRASEVESATHAEPVTLNIGGESFIGQPRKRMLGELNCFRISTGAIIPEGSDSVVRVEDTEMLADGRVRVLEPVSAGTNIAEAGSDITSGELLMLAGKQIDTNDIAVLASLGIPEIDVYRKLIISVISTGNELISHTEPYREGSISDANGIAVCNELNTFQFIEATYAGIARDVYGEINGKIEESLSHSDIVILSGGSSAGESDLVYRIIDEMAPGMVFHGVLVKPGLPTVLGRSGEKAVIGLPGFPVSSMMIFRSIFLSAILAAGRFEMETRPDIGTLAVNLKLEMGKQNLIPVNVFHGTPNRVYPVTGLSGSISRFISTSGFISLEGNTKFLEAGTEVAVVKWSKEFEDRRPGISGMIVQMGQEESILEMLPSLKYIRMSPRNSLKSLSNRDSIISAFYFTNGFNVADYVRSEMGNVDFVLFKGSAVEVGIECPKPVKTLEGAFAAIEKGEMLAGPALRFLEEVVTSDDNLERLIQAIRSNLSSYSATDLYGSNKEKQGAKTEFTLSIKGKMKQNSKNWMKAFEIVPAFVTLQKDFLERYPGLTEKLKPLQS